MINKENDYGRTPLFYACKSENETMVKFLVEHGADVHKEYINIKKRFNNYSSYENEPFIKFLAKIGIDVYKGNGSGKISCNNIYAESFEYMSYFLGIDGFDVTIVNEDSETRLFHVRNQNNKIIANLVMKRNEYKGGKKLYFYRCFNDNYTILNYLVKWEVDEIKRNNLVKPCYFMPVIMKINQ